MRTASSSAKTFDSRLIERLASVPARSSSATWSMEPILGSLGSSGSSKPVGSTGACAMKRSLAPCRGLAGPRQQPIGNGADVVADRVGAGKLPTGAARRADHHRADAGFVGAGDVTRRVSDGDGLAGRPVTCSLAGEPEQLATRFGVAAEGSLTVREEAGQPEPLEAGAGHRLRVAGQERELNSAFPEPLQRERRSGLDLPAAGLAGAEQLEVALGEERAPAVELLVDSRVVETFGAQHLAGDSLRRLAGVIDALDGIAGRPDAVELAKGSQHRLAREGVVGEEERAVDVEQRKQGHQMPRRSSI